jgi:5-hydroxyisourate hydrolase-like protein (transthyretin family)
MIKSIFLYGSLFFLGLSSAFASASFVKATSPIDPEMIYGGVRHANSDKPLKDVTITVIQLHNYKEKTLQTDMHGEFGIDDLRPGTYKLVFQKDGYKKVVKDKIIVKSDNAIQLQIEMEETGYDLSPSPFHFFKY